MEGRGGRTRSHSRWSLRYF